MHVIVVYHEFEKKYLVELSSKTVEWITAIVNLKRLIIICTVFKLNIGLSKVTTQTMQYSGSGWISGY